MTISEELVTSIEARGIIIPVKVECIDGDMYRCVDGHKRLNACKQIEDKTNCEFEVFCMLVNDFSKSGSTYWGARNHH
ncbi:MAG: ParB/Srx family N-terminal domain-containing protein [Anaerorhabdus sp.]